MPRCALPAVLLLLLAAGSLPAEPAARTTTRQADSRMTRSARSCGRPRLLRDRARPRSGDRAVVAGSGAGPHVAVQLGDRHAEARALIPTHWQRQPGLILRRLD